MDPSLMAGDGFHPGPGLYAKVAQRLAAHITRRCCRASEKDRGDA